MVVFGDIFRKNPFRDPWVRLILTCLLQHIMLWCQQGSHGAIIDLCHPVFLNFSCYFFFNLSSLHNTGCLHSKEKGIESHMGPSPPASPDYGPLVHHCRCSSCALALDSAAITSPHHLFFSVTRAVSKSSCMGIVDWSGKIAMGGDTKIHVLLTGFGH
jgi:hypothetical protein